MKKTYLKVTCFLLAVLLLLPFTRLGPSKELKRWDAPEPNSFGHSKPLYLSITQSRSFLDPFGWSKRERLVISDGGYICVVYFDIPPYADDSWIDTCKVTWDTNGVTLKFSCGVSISVDKKLIMSQL